MIKLVVEPYCQNCRDFDPVVKSNTLDIEDVGSDCTGIIHITNTEVRCRYCKRCENIKRYLDKENKKNGKTD